MGKIKRKRLRVSRYSPTHINGKGKDRKASDELSPNKLSGDLNEDISDTSLPHTSLNDYDECAGNNVNKVTGGLKTAREKILSNIAEERVTGLNMLAAFALESKAAESIITNKICTCVAPLLKDASSQVRLAAAGALRNMCAWGSDDDIETIVQQDILQPLSQLLKTYEANVPVSSPSKPNSFNYTKGVANSMEESDPHHLIFIHATNVLWSLCECNEEALDTFNSEGLVNVLLKHINPFVWNYSISLAAADCLLCVSENNPKTASEILPLADTLLSLVLKSLSNNCDAFGLQFAIVISGVLLNIGYWVPGDSNFRQVFEVVNKVLELDASSHLLCPSQGQSKASIQQQFEHIISAQLVSLEILSNICAPDEDDEDWEECEENNSDQIDDDVNDNLMECENGNNATSLPVEVLEGIKFFQLVDKTYTKIAMPVFGDSGRTDEENKSISEKFCQLQIRALQCLQNLVSCLQIDDLGGAENLYNTWLNLGKISFTNSPQTDLLEATSGAMRAIIQKLSEKDSPHEFNLSSHDLQSIFEAAVSCELASVRSNLCRMVGTLGCSFLKHVSDQDLSGHQAQEFLNPIIEFLLKIGQEDSALWVRAEALDVIIDLFSDDKTDRLAANCRLVERLREIHPDFKFNQQRKKLGDHRPLVLTVRDNLVAFIKYKGPRTAKLAKLGH